MVEQFGHLLPSHPLRREIIATIVTNDVINSMGITFVPRMAAETGATAEEVARAFLVARDVSAARDRWDAVERLDGVVPGDVQAELMDGVDSMVEQLARWYLQHVHDIDLTAEVERGRPGVRGARADALGRGHRRVAGGDRRPARGASRAGRPRRARAVRGRRPALVYAPDIISVAQETGRSIAEVARAFFSSASACTSTLVEAPGGRPARPRPVAAAGLGTLLDDLRLLRRQIVERVIAESQNGSIDDAVDAYLSARSDPYDRLSRMMENVTTAPPDDSSMVMVAVHQIRQVAA